MEQYPSISKIVVNTPILAFPKMDGNNIRAEFSPKTGFKKFGSRKRLLDESDELLGGSIPIFREKYEEDLTKILRRTGVQKATVFMEYYGQKSFAGFHEEGDPLTLTLFDTHFYKKGLLPPKEFLKIFGGKVEVSEPIYEGNPNSNFIKAVKDGTLEGMLLEGVVCKGGLDSRGRVTMFKVKSDAWLQRLKDRCAGDEALFEELS